MPQAWKAFVTPDVSKPPIQAVMEQTDNYTEVSKFIQIHFLKTIPEAKDQGTKNWVHLHYITLTAKHYITLALHSITLAAKNKPRQFFFFKTYAQIPAQILRICHHPLQWKRKPRSKPKIETETPPR